MILRIFAEVQYSPKLLFGSTVFAEASGLADPIHLGAMQQLLLTLVQHAVDILRRRWNAHRVSSTARGRRGGVPDQLILQHGHPGGQMQLGMGEDMVARYEAARGTPVRREPVWRAQRDRLPACTANQAAAAACCSGACCVGQSVRRRRGRTSCCFEGATASSRASMCGCCTGENMKNVNVEL